MKYKVGDKVKIKSLEWYNAFSNNWKEYIRNDRAWFTKEMAEYCGKTAIVIGIYNDSYDLDIDNKEWGWYDWMLEDETTVPDQLKEKRFHAACSAMNGIVSGLMQSDEWHGWTDKYIAERAYLLADELLKQGGFNE